MASSSTASTHHKSFKYDVFLSFRGEDTRKNFIDHIYHALQEKSIHTYKDDDRINKGKRISDDLIGSIEDSKYFIIVFSKNYASSSWCLNELVKIMECHKTTEHTAYPVFHDVEPTKVHKQSGAVGEAFAKHENDEAAEKWRETMKEAADLAGWELKNTRNEHEAKFIQTIVEEISIELRSINYCVDENLVGMETRITDIVSSLRSGSDDVHMIGIRGIGGGGKTTLARAVFNKISFQFEGKSFIKNVREVSKASLSGLKSLQNKVLSDLVNNKGINTGSEHEMNKMLRRIMCARKVLLVLDDVDHIDQLEALAGGYNWFKPGSIIIITTREKQVFVAHGVKLIYNVNLLSNKEAICLFGRYAFGRDIPKGYGKLSRQVVCYAAGLPLTVKVLGSFLCGKVLNNLRFLDLSYSLLKTFDLGLTPNLETLTLKGCTNLSELHISVECPRLRSLKISGPKLRAIDLQMTPNLENLDLNGHLVELYMPQECLMLRSLKLSSSSIRTLDLWVTPNLKKLDLNECNNLVELRAPIGCLKNIVYLDLSGCSMFTSFLLHIKHDTSYSTDESHEAGSLAELHFTPKICPVHLGNYLPKFQFTCFHKEDLPSLTRDLEKLISVGKGPYVCTKLETFRKSLVGYNVRKLKGGIPESSKRS